MCLDILQQRTHAGDGTAHVQRHQQDGDKSGATASTEGMQFCC
jgi:hypothetical protein